MTQESTPESAGSARPFKYNGNQGEFTLLAPLKPGRAERAWQIAREAEENFNEVSAAIHSIGTLHDVRIALFDNDSRMLFAAIYDGTGTSTSTTLRPALSTGVCLLRCALGEFGGLPGSEEPRREGLPSQVPGPDRFLLDRSA